MLIADVLRRRLGSSTATRNSLATSSAVNSGEFAPRPAASATSRRVGRRRARRIGLELSNLVEDLSAATMAGDYGYGQLVQAFDFPSLVDTRPARSLHRRVGLRT